MLRTRPAGRTAVQPRPGLLTTTLAIAVAIFALALLGAGTAAADTAAAPRTCRLSPTQQQNAGATYLVQLKVTGVSCSTSLKLEKAWQACRRATAGRTSCRR